jgi:hypothetical protein
MLVSNLTLVLSDSNAATSEVWITGNEEHRQSGNSPLKGAQTTPGGTCSEGIERTSGSLHHRQRGRRSRGAASDRQRGRRSRGAASDAVTGMSRDRPAVTLKDREGPARTVKLSAPPAGAGGLYCCSHRARRCHTPRWPSTVDSGMSPLQTRNSVCSPSARLSSSLAPQDDRDVDRGNGRQEH